MDCLANTFSLINSPCSRQNRCHLHSCNVRKLHFNAGRVSQTNASFLSLSFQWKRQQKKVNIDEKAKRRERRGEKRKQYMFA